MRGGVGSRDSRGGPGGNDGLDGLPSLVTAATKGGNGKYVKTVIYDAEGRIASAVIEGTVGGTTPSSPGTASEGASEAVARVDHVHGGGSIYDVWKAEAAADLGIAPSGLVFLMMGDVHPSWTGTTSGAGGGTFLATPDGWGKRLLTSGAANGTAHSFFSNLTTVPPMAVSGAPAKWWMKSRFAVNNGAFGPAGAATVAGYAIRSTIAVNGTHELVFGVDGAVSTTNFIVSATAGATIDSLIPIDALVRDHKLYRANGADTIYQIDSNTPVVGTARPNVSGHGAVMVFDSAAVAHACDVYLQAMAFPVRALGV